MNLWMRWLDFRALRDLLLLVAAHPGGLRANELGKLATDERVLLRLDGRPCAQSTHYHYRRTLERLGLLVKHERRFTLNHQNTETSALTAQRTLLEELQLSEKEAFANAVIRNKDCHEVFFANFLPGREAVFDVAAFVERAHPVKIEILHADRRTTKNGRSLNASSDASKRVAISPAGGADRNVLDGAEAVQAIHFGLKSWCVNQLGFLDIVCDANGTYTIYPKHIIERRTDRELAAEMFAELEFADDWATVRIPDIALATGIKQRVSVAQAKEVLTGWLADHPDLVAGVPTRVGFITAGLPESQQALALKSYLRSESGAYLSHLRIHRMLRERVENGVLTL